VRRWHRAAAPPQLVAFLDRKQLEVDAGGPAELLWKRARKTKSLGRLASLLASATGTRERCMYCEDSRGTDIEHYRPRAGHPGLIFRWHNWLWACSGCNRSKSGRFPVDAASGAALLIDPSAEDPWEFLVFESRTGEITARWHGNVEDARGRATLETLSPLRGQAVCEGRARTRRHLIRALKAFLAEPGDEDAGPRINELVHWVRDADDYGLVEWFFLRDGGEETPFRQLRDGRPLAWERVQHEVQNPA